MTNNGSGKKDNGSPSKQQDSGSKNGNKRQQSSSSLSSSSSSSQGSSAAINTSVTPTTCPTIGCGFFGNTLFGSLCSMCYKKQSSKAAPPAAVSSSSRSATPSKTAKTTRRIVKLRLKSRAPTPTAKTVKVVVSKTKTNPSHVQGSLSSSSSDSGYRSDLDTRRSSLEVAKSGATGATPTATTLSTSTSSNQTCTSTTGSFTSSGGLTSPSTAITSKQLNEALSKSRPSTPYPPGSGPSLGKQQLPLDLSMQKSQQLLQGGSFGTKVSVEMPPPAIPAARPSTIIESSAASRSSASSTSFLSGTSSSSSIKTGSGATASKKAGKKANRCHLTGCAVSLLTIGFDCRCGGRYCIKHQLATQHACTFDYRAAGQVELAKSNPKVVADKIKKI